MGEYGLVRVDWICVGMGDWAWGVKAGMGIMGCGVMRIGLDFWDGG